jgi:hypothetical protein
MVIAIRFLFLLIVLFPLTCNSAGISMMSGGGNPTLDDSNPLGTVNYDSINSTYTKYAQCFTTGGGILDSVKFYLYRITDAAGNMNATIYAHTGTYGTVDSGEPTGASLATSDTINANTLGVNVGNVAWVTFNFTGANRIPLSAATAYYCVALEYAGATAIKIGYNTSSTHSGTQAYWDLAVWESDNVDINFYLYVYR